MKYVVIIVTLDTKSAEAAYLRDCILELGHAALVLDVGCGGLPQMEADIPAAEIARLAGVVLDNLRERHDRDAVTGTMIRGAVVKLSEMCSRNEVEGLISIGGMSSAAMASNIYKEMPYRIPKLLFTTAASMPQCHRFFGPSGVTVMHSLVDLGSLNPLLKGELARAAGAICGMIRGQVLAARHATNSKPMIAMSTNGWVETPAQFVTECLREDYEIVRFHATGLPEVVMERLIDDDYFEAVIDLVPSSITNAKFNGSRISWPRRMEVAGEKGIPQVVAPSLVNTISRERDNSPALLEEMRKRKYYFMDSLRVLLWLTKEELTEIAPVYAEKLNKAVGPVKFLIPLKGWSSIETEGSDYFEPESIAAFTHELRKFLNPHVEIVEIDANIDTVEFGQAVVQAFSQVVAARRQG